MTTEKDTLSADQGVVDPGTLSRSELVWRQYEMYVGLYQFYIDALIKLNGFAFAITGGLVGYYLAHRDQRGIQLALLLPAAISFGQSILLAMSFKRVGNLEKDAERQRTDLDLKSRPEFAPLWGLMVLFLGLHILILAGLAALILEQARLDWV